MSGAVSEVDEGDALGEEALAPGTTLLNAQYKIDRYLSAGGFGITYLARDSLNRQVVIKECFPEAVCSRRKKTVHARSRAHQGDFRSFVALFVREARSLSKLQHPNVVGVHQIFEDNETAYMALDLIDGDDLLSIIEDAGKSIVAQDIRGILLKILDAVDLIHSQDMLHRDISPDNILINQSGDPVLIDFGAAREEASKKSRALSSVLVVKDGYSPQEFYIGGSRQGPFSDIYALGATFYHLISGEAPPHSQTRLAEIASNSPDPCEPLVGRFKEYDPAFLASIDKAISVFPRDRLQSAKQWIDWIRKNGDAPQNAALALENENSIKALMAKLPRIAPVEPAATTPQTQQTEPAQDRYVLDLADLRAKGVKQHRSRTVAQQAQPIEPIPGERTKRPVGRLLASAALIGAMGTSTHPEFFSAATLPVSLAEIQIVETTQLIFSPALKGTP